MKTKETIIVQPRRTGFGTLWLIIILGISLYAANRATKTENYEISSGNEITITEEEIKEYISMSGATQIITVIQDSTWIKTTYLIDNTLFGKRYTYLETKTPNKMRETRVWKVTAGVDGEISMKFTMDTVFLQLQDAKILHIEELQNKYTVAQKGEWDAKSIHELATRSFAIANSSAIENGICNDAFANVAQFLAFKMPVQTVVNGFAIMQKRSETFSQKNLTIAR